MTPKLVLVLVLLFSFVLGRVLDAARGRFVPPTGAVWVAVGVALGPLAFDVVDRRLIEGSRPVVSFLLGLLAFVEGARLRRHLGDRRAVVAGALGGGLVVAGLACGALGLLAVTSGVRDVVRWQWVALTLGAVAAVVDGPTLTALADRAKAAGPVRELLRPFALASTITAIAIVGASLALARAGGVADAEGAAWVAAAPAIGVVCGALFSVFVGAGGPDRVFVGSIGILALTSGLSSAVGLSPLLAGLAAGLTVSGLSRHGADVADAVEHLAPPAMVGLMVLAGAAWSPPSGLLWLVPVGVAVARLAAGRLAGAVAPRLVPGTPRAPRLGMALLPQGALGVALAVDFAQVFPADAPLALTAALLCAAIGDRFGFPAVRRVLADAGEIAHRAAPSLGATP